MSCIRFEVPVETVNTSNRREHHMQRHKRAKGQRAATHLLWPGWSGPALLVVRLTRMSLRALDSGDNLPIAMKSIRDEVARQLRLDDASPLVRWVYAQAQGAPSVLVELSWGDDPLAAAVRAQDALAPPPPPVLTEAAAPRAPKARKPKAPKKAPSRPLRGLAALATSAFTSGGKKA
ncbi:hypothetical protein [Corallococcus carmarthensis]|uniref:Uncharacterized protein n=1 Tax=Corallococcus carmarthensis TaxID=2316728 RepID=A0A3A8KRQ7_9BACT|nr:hypothetical protein [Corallococcus carmarthensis]RKH05092.1 hypothetical protein D7X32_09255 [Corallococcus carmarthensis]